MEKKKVQIFPTKHAQWVSPILQFQLLVLCYQSQKSAKTNDQKKQFAHLEHYPPLFYFSRLRIYRYKQAQPKTTRFYQLSQHSKVNGPL